MSYTVNLQNILKQKNSILYNKLQEIEKLAAPLLNYTAGSFPYFTPHGFSHSKQVEENLNWLIPDEIKPSLNEWEIFFMIVAAWMHDWGMVCKPGESPEHVRKTHHVRTEQNFEEMYDKLKLDKHEAIIIGRIARGHRVEDLRGSLFDSVVFSSNNKIDVRFLTALVRLADECDMTYNRVPELVYYSLNPQGSSDEHFKKHLSIGGVGKVNQKIVFYGVAYDPKGSKTLRLLQEKIQKEIDHVKTILSEKKIIIEFAEAHIDARGFIDKPISFRLDEKKITELLIGKSIYSSPNVAVRELIQNSLDACRYRNNLQKNKDTRIRIYKEDNILTIEDNGIGMDFEKAKNFLSTKGFSYYTSDEFNKQKDQLDFDPISRWGLGILSCFLIAKNIEIETKSESTEPCRFIIDEVGEGWRFEKCNIQNQGTKIKLTLNDAAKDIDLEKIIHHFVKSSTIPIFLGKDTTVPIHFDWNVKDPDVQDVLTRYIGIATPTVAETPFEFEDDEFHVKSYLSSQPVFSGMLISNQGIFVSQNPLIPSPSSQVMLVNVKKDLLDLDISRNNIQFNTKKSTEFLQKWLQRLQKFMEDAIEKDLKKYDPNIITKFFVVNLELQNFGIMSHILIRLRSDVEMNKLEPALNKFLFEYKFNLVLTNDGLELLSLNDIIARKPTKIYQYAIEPSFDEADELNEDHKIEVETIVTKMNNLKSDEIVIFNTIDDMDEWDPINKTLIEKSNNTITIEQLEIIGIFKDTKIISTKLESLLPKNAHFGDIPNIFASCVLCTKPYTVERVERGFGYHAISILELENDPELKIIEQGKFLFDKNDEFIKLLMMKEQDVLSSNIIADAVKFYFKILALKFLAYPRFPFDLLLNDKEQYILDQLKIFKKPLSIEKRLGKCSTLLQLHNPSYSPIIDRSTRNVRRLARFLMR